MLSDRATHHAVALRALTGIGALRDTGRIGSEDGHTADAETISRLVLLSVADLDRRDVASRTRWDIAEEHVERAYSIVTGTRR